MFRWHISSATYALVAPQKSCVQTCAPRVVLQKWCKSSLPSQGWGQGLLGGQFMSAAWVLRCHQGLGEEGLQQSQREPHCSQTCLSASAGLGPPMADNPARFQSYSHRQPGPGGCSSACHAPEGKQAISVWACWEPPREPPQFTDWGGRWGRKCGW